MGHLDTAPAVLTTRAAAATGRSGLLRDGTYRRVAPGLHLVASADPDDPDVRVALASAALPPGTTLGGWAAARQHERRRAPRRDHLQIDGFTGIPPRPAPVLVLADPATRLVERPFRRVLRSRVAATEREVVDGLPVTSPLRTAFDIGRLDGLREAVAAVDRLRALGLVDPSELVRLIDEHAHWPGARRARRVLAFSSERVESAQESAMRVLWCEAGLPRPVSNPTIVDLDGAFVARVDVLDPDAGLVGEYDGAVHASARRRSTDAARQERLEQLGLVVIRATAVDLASEPARAAWCARLRHARARARTSHHRAWRYR